MKCTLLNSKRLLKFCRFLRLNDNRGFHLEEGRGTENYRYFGNGFEHYDCGISIQNPNAADKSMWKCFMGVEQNGDTATVGKIVNGMETPKDEGKIFSKLKK